MKTPIEIDLLKALVAFPTLTSDPATSERALNFVENYLEARGMYTVREQHDQYGSLIATTRPTKTPTVMLVAHIDVVPAPERLFNVREENGRLYGRGVWDMKMAIAGYMALVGRLQETLSDYDFGIMIVSDEEGSDRTTGELLKQGYIPKVVILPDASEDWRVESRAKGSWNLHVIVKGRSAHGSRPWEGDSASMKLLDALAEIRALFAGNSREESSLNISMFSGGKAHNQIPDHAEAFLDVRAPSNEEYERIESAIQDICAQHDATMTVEHFFPAIEHDLENPYRADFIRSIEKITGNDHEDFMSYGASSAIHFMQRSIPCILTEPTGGDRHGPHEWLDKESFLHFVPILEDFMQQNGRVASLATDRMSVTETA